MPRDVEDALPGVVERRADVEAPPLAARRRPVSPTSRATTSKLPPSSSVAAGQHHRPLAEQRLAQQPAHGERGDLERRPATRVVSHPGDVVRRVAGESLGGVEHHADRRLGQLARAVVRVFRRLRPDMHAPGRIAHQRDRRRRAPRGARPVDPPAARRSPPPAPSPAASRSPITSSSSSRRPRATARSTIAAVSSAGGHTGHPVDQLVRLVDDDHVVLRKDLEALEGVDREHRVVGDDDSTPAGPLPRQLGEAVLTVRALERAEALPGRHADLAARPGRRRPGPSSSRSPVSVSSAQSRSRTTSRPSVARRRGVEQDVALTVVGHPAGDLVPAEVVARDPSGSRTSGAGPAAARPHRRGPAGHGRRPGSAGRWSPSR